MIKWQKPLLTCGKVSELLSKLQGSGIKARYETGPEGPAKLIMLPPEQWGMAADVAADKGLRWSAVWGEHLPPQITITSVLFGQDGHILLRTELPEVQPELTSQTAHYPAANRPERYIQDMFGVHFTDHPDGRRWMCHQAWWQDQFPLLKDFPRAGTPQEQTPPDCEYPFNSIAGSGIYEIPVGPVHAGIIEPGHFRFQAVGETILSLEEHLGYVHRGVEKIAEGRELDGLARLAGRVSGDSTVTHTWAACQAAERALGVTVPPRALALRAIMSERERIANHLGDIGAVCNDVGFTFAQVQFSRLREIWQRQSFKAFGHRLLMDTIVPGGVVVGISSAFINDLKVEAAYLKNEVKELMPLLLEYPSLQDRLRETGILTPEQARTHGVLGYIGRASNHQDDLRRDAAYPPYDKLEVTVPAYTQGDVAKRVRVRGDEIIVSLELISQLLRKLPTDGPLAVPCPPSGRECAGIGMVEGWRGETLCYLHLDEHRRVLRYFPRDPSWLSWPALEVLIHDNIVPDFPVCNKSVNGSYAGHDL